MTSLRDQFLLDPSITFLNFGSFGACPRPVFEKYQAFQRQMEFEPVQFIMKDGMEMLRAARQRLGDYVGCPADNLVYILNPSYGINAVAKSFAFEAGDEILATDLEYGALDRTWNYYCQKAGARYARTPIRLPVQSKEAFLEDFWKGYSKKTKAIFISHITSSTGLILPAKEICAEAKKRGLRTIVDGAHVPGHIDLDLATLGADIYVGACHKWMMAPKGASFLYVNRENQHWIDPLVISWGFQSETPSHSQFLDYHQTMGTRDFSASLTVPACLDFMEKYDWPTVAKSCREMVLQNAERFCRITDCEPISPLDKTWLGQLYSIPVRTGDPVALYQKLFQDYRIEIPVMKQGDRVFIRFSIQAYNRPEDLDRLEEALREIKRNSTLMN
jgi:isopenicillin-N epimerase